jgi:hypothetical protein
MKLSVFTFFQEGVGRIVTVAESFEEAMVILKKEVSTANAFDWNFSIENIILESTISCERGNAVWL